MANRIKGITVEIGGDTTKLDKALKGTNKEISDTQRNLKDVERLLKMDPGNMDLLAQKQGYLADKAALTKEKYDQLKTALDNATASNANFEKWEKAQADLQGQITKSENALKDLEAEAKKLQQQGFAPDSSEMASVQEQIEATKNRTEALRKELTETFDELGRPISMEQFKSLQRETFAAGEEAKDAEREYKNFDVELEAFSATATKVQEKAAAVAEATKKISAVAAAGAAGLVGLAVKAGMAADDLNALSKQSGFATDTLQKWQYASDIVDVSVDDIVGAARKMKKNMVSTSADVTAAWERLGIGVRDNNGQLRDAEYVFNDVIMALSQIPNEVDRDTVAMTLLGRSADSLAGIIDDGGAALRALGQEAEDAGLILSQEALDGANEFNDGIDRLKATAKASFMESGAALAQNLLPEMEKLVQSLSKVLEWVSNLDGSTLRMIATMLALVAAISPVARAISAVAGVMATINTILPAVTGGFAALWAVISANPIGAILTLITALIAAFVYFYKTNDEFRERVQAAWEAVKETVLGVVDAIKNAINTISNLPGKITGMFSGGTSDSRVRGFATGGVFMPNSPVLGILGDNRNEREVAAPESTLMEIFGRALDARGSSGSAQTINIQFSGSLAQLGRVLQPVVTTETARQGVNLIK